MIGGKGADQDRLVSELKVIERRLDHFRSELNLKASACQAAGSTNQFKYLSISKRLSYC